jgi:hypothetical protein
MRDVRAADAGDAGAQLAIGVYRHRLRREIAAMAAATNGLDVLNVTGGIGERHPQIRAAAADGIGRLGVALDPGRNKATAGADVSDPSAPRASWSSRCGKTSKLPGKRAACWRPPGSHPPSAQAWPAPASDKRDVYFPVMDVPFHCEPRGGQDVLHRVVLQHRLGIEYRDAVPPVDRDQLLEQDRRYSVSVHVVGDRERDLRVSRRSKELVTRDPDQPAIRYRHQRRMILRSGRHTRLASCSGACGLKLKKRRYKLPGDMLPCIARTASKSPGSACRISLLLPPASSTCSADPGCTAGCSPVAASAAAVLCVIAKACAGTAGVATRAEGLWHWDLRPARPRDLL